MISAGYNDPNYGLPSDGGGAFIGTGATTSCIMPSPMQPATPVGGLFGPDSYAPFWGNPGYTTPENMSNPGIFLPYMPAPIPPDAFSMLGGDGISGTLGTRPSKEQSRQGCPPYSILLSALQFTLQY